MSKTFTISELAREFQVTPRAIRFYESQDLLHPERNGQNRIFSEVDRVRLAWILRGKRVGFSLAELKELLDLYDLDDDRSTQRKVTYRKCVDQLASLKRQRDDLDATIDELENFIVTLGDLLKDGHGSDQATGIAAE